MRISEPSFLTGSGERRVKCALPPHLTQRSGLINVCSLTTKERFSTAPPPNPRRSNFMQSDKGREIWTVPQFSVKKLCKTAHCAKREPVPGPDRTLGSRVKTKRSGPGLHSGPPYGNPRQARGVWNTTLYRHGPQRV